MLSSILRVIHILISIGLIAGVLLQSGKSAGLSGAIDGGAEAFFGSKKKGMDEKLNKLTMFAAVAFMVTSVLLALV